MTYVITQISNKSAKRPLPERVRAISTRVTEAEYARLLERAEREHLSISEWARGVLEKRLHDDEMRQRILAELWALRYVLINGLTSLASESERPMFVATLDRLIAEADQKKADKARRLLGAV